MFLHSLPFHYGFDIYLLGGGFYAQNISQTSTVIGSILLILALLSAIFSIIYHYKLYKELNKITQNKIFMLCFALLAISVLALFFFFGAAPAMIASFIELLAFKNIELKNQAIYKV